MPDTLVIDAMSLLTRITGIGKYTLEVCRAMERIEDSGFATTYYYGFYGKRLRTPPGGDDSAGPGFAGTLLKKLPWLKSAVRNGLLAATRLSLRTFDVYWEPKIVPLDVITAKRTVPTIHDFSMQKHPEWHPADRLAYYGRNALPRMKRADIAITGSRYTAGEITEILGIPEERIRVIPHAVDHDLFRPRPDDDLAAFRARLDLPERYILYVGSIEPRKNLPGALRAYRALPEHIKRSCGFLIAGFTGWHNRDIMDMINAEAGNIRYLGYIDEPTLAMLYAAAAAFVFPSYYEGFGLPPLEAMASGCPVIVSRNTSLPEVVGDAGRYIDDADDADAIRQAIMDVVDDQDVMRLLSEKGIERARGFSWERSARAHLAAFRDSLET